VVVELDGLQQQQQLPSGGRERRRGRQYDVCLRVPETLAPPLPGGDAKNMVFGGAGVYVHYFKNIRHGALQAD